MICAIGVLLVTSQSSLGDRCLRMTKDEWPLIRSSSSYLHSLTCICFQIILRGCFKSPISCSKSYRSPKFHRLRQPCPPISNCSCKSRFDPFPSLLNRGTWEHLGSFPSLSKKVREIGLTCVDTVALKRELGGIPKRTMKQSKLCKIPS